MNKHIRIITVATLAMLGVICIASGIMYSSLQNKQIDETVLVVVEHKQINKNIDVNLKLKNITIEVNTPLSVKIVDYLDIAVTDEVLANLKLDTSSVNVTQVGTYNYTVTHDKKTYNGIVIVKPQQIDNSIIQSITLKPINIKLGTALQTDISYYIIEQVSDFEKSTMLLNLSNVNVNKAGTYQYSITYNQSIYTGNITVTEEQPTLSTNKNDQITNSDEIIDNEQTPDTEENLNTGVTTQPEELEKNPEGESNQLNQTN